MKKDKEEKLNETPDESPADELVEELKQPEEPEIDLEALKLGEIESSEAVPTEEHEESADPDKEVVIKKSPTTQKWWKRRKIMIPAGVVLLLVVLLAIPPTRYMMLGWAWREDVSVLVTDTTSHSPVSNAAVSIDGHSATTDGAGVATIKAIPIGYRTLHIEKKNYKTNEQAIAVDVFSAGQKRDIALVATGRLVNVRVTDRLTGKPVAEATIADDKTTYGRTDASGKVTVVVPAKDQKINATVVAAKYNGFSTVISPENANITLISTAKMYFLSKQSGKIDVVKTNLDGSDRKVVVPGTGDEDDRSTTLLAARDWKYLVLKSKRAPNKPESLYIVNTTNDSYTVLDEGNAVFTSIGWSGHNFMYETVRQNTEYWRAKSTAIKSFNADNSNLVTLDENAADPLSVDSSPAYERLSNYYILDGLLSYTKTWSFSGYRFSPGVLEAVAKDKPSTIMSVKPDGTGRKILRSFPSATLSYVNAKLYLPQEVYYQAADRSDPVKYTYLELEDGTVKSNASGADSFGNKTYPTYLMSPNGNASFWSEERDGKNALFVGGKNAENKQEVAVASEFKAYGWLTDDWILLQKQNSELYITTIDQLKAGGTPLKISDYHKVASSLVGYGYGYGGL
jgi:hypothetical protein